MRNSKRAGRLLSVAAAFLTAAFLLSGQSEEQRASDLNYHSNFPPIRAGEVPDDLLHNISLVSFPREHRSFNMVNGSFDSLPLWRVEELDRLSFRSMMFLDVPSDIRSRMNRYIDIALDVAEKHQIDPCWVMAVMWTESHFDPGAVSSAGAVGLMQILPQTGRYLGAELAQRDVSALEVYEMLENPGTNIEMGVIYLKHLLNRFDGNYIFATVAYNMGPTTVRRRLIAGKPVGVRNNYLDKVRSAYKMLSSGYRTYIRNTTAESLATYVADPDMRAEDELLDAVSLVSFATDSTLL